MKKFKCNCGNESTDRCHGTFPGEDRKSLIKKALENVWPDISKPIIMKDIVIEFLELHKNTQFDFKCKKCHDKETYLK